MHCQASRLACGVALVALLAHTPPAGAEIITTGTATNPVNVGGNATAGFIAIGPTATGEMLVQNGSVLTMAPLAIDAGQINIAGNQGASPTAGNGTLTVQGSGSRIEFTGPESILVAGRWGSTSVATVNILNGGVINMTAGFGVRLGRGNSDPGFGTDGATGLMRVDGAGSALLITGIDSAGAAPGLMIGRDQGFGQLTIANGGLVSIGTTATTSSAFLTIGGRSPAGGSTLATSSGRGDVLVTGVGSSLRMLGAGNGNGITVGNFGSSSLAGFTIDKGATADATFFSVGVSGTTGTATIDGAGSSLHLAGVGRAGEAPGGTIGREGGTGTLTIRNGGALTIDAAAATQSGGGFTIGREGGTGALVVETGGSLSIAGSTVGGMGLTAGRSAGNGRIDIRSGGTLHVATPSGPAASGSGLTLGRDAGSTGAMTIDNGTVVIDIAHDRSSAFRSAVQVGRGGTGSLDIVNGGSLTMSAKEILTTLVSVGGLYAADPAARVSGTGRITVAGPGSRLIMTGDDANLEIGHWGTASRGDLLVAGGAAVQTQTLRIGVGRDGANGATGRAEFTGAGTTLVLSGRDVDNDGGQIWVGRDGGSGELVIRNGARVTLDGSKASGDGNAFLNIGGRAPAGTPGTSSEVIGSSATGKVTVTGAGTRVDFVGAGGIEGGGGSINVGRWGSDTNATMTIADGAHVTTTFVAVGRGDTVGGGSKGALVVDNATLNLTGANAAGAGAFLGIGRDDGGRGTMLIDNGGRVAIDGSAATSTANRAGVSVGRSVGATGALTIDHGSRLDAARFLGVGTHFTGGAVVEAGTGTLELKRGAFARAESVQVGALGRVSVDASTLEANEIVLRGGTVPGGSQLVLNDGLITAGTIEAFSGAGIHGTGSLDVGTVTLHAGAVLDPGFSPGTLRIAGDLVAEAGARIQLDFVENPDGSIVRDLIEVAGRLSSAAQIEIQLGGTAVFDDVDGKSLSMFLVDEDGVGLGHAFDGGSVTVFGAGGTVRRYSIVDSVLVGDTVPRDVPAPATLALLGIGTAALSFMRRRTR